MKKYQSFNCCIIGESSLTLQCIEILHKTGHNIECIVSHYPAIHEWARTQDIFCTKNVRQLEHQKPYDYLFSIANDAILSPKALEKPRFFAIDVHDSLLPYYGGFHATSWAILNSEIQHGVTWHVPNNSNTYKILKQATIEITPEETAFSLNLKCYEQAKKLFTQLLDELTTQTYTIRLSLKQRTLYTQYRKPKNNGLIDWHDSAEKISCLVRGLDFGNQPNSLSTAKIILFNKLLILKSLETTANYSTKVPGTIIDLTTEYCQVSTGTYDVRITTLSDGDGQPYPLINLQAPWTATKKATHIITLNEKLCQSLEKKSAQFAKHEMFWMQQLTNIHPLHFPFLPTSNVADHHIHKQYLIAETHIPEKLALSLEKQYPQASLEKILLTALYLYLYLSTQQHILSIGLSFSTLSKKLKDLSLFFSTVLPCTVILQDHLTFQQTLEKIIKEHNQIGKKGSFLNDIASRHPTHSKIQHALQIIVACVKKLPENTEGLKNHLQFRISRFDKKIAIYANKTICSPELQVVLKSMAKNLLSLLTDIANNPEKKVNQFLLLDDSERNKLLFDWNKTSAFFPDQKTIHQLFEQQVEKTPNEIAVTFKNTSLTYQQLNHKANLLADTLNSLGAIPDAKIILCVERNLDVIIGLLGILKSGAAYLPIETNWPTLRIKKIIRDARPMAIITQTSYLAKFSQMALKNNPIITLDNFDKFPKTRHVKNSKLSIKCNHSLRRPAPTTCSRDHPWDPDQASTETGSHEQAAGRRGKGRAITTKSNNLAYVIYTSGSTGKPKGVLVRHSSVVNCLVATKKLLNIKSADVFLTVTSLSFDMAALDYFLPLSLGAKIVIAGTDDQKNAKNIIELIREKLITVMLATPTTWEIFRTLGYTLPRKLKMLTVGEALLPQLAKYLIENGELFNIYGPTEATLYATFKKIINPEIITIGKPIQNTKIYILGKNLQFLPIGFPGELHISGACLANGYLNRPALTKEKFIETLLPNGEKLKLYKTGDLARWLPNGELEYICRIDHQVKIHGSRVELGEIEQALLTYPQIAQTVVILNKENIGHLQLVAFIVLKAPYAPTCSLTASELQNFLKQQLPDHMVPTSYVILPKFPISDNGKIDRIALLTHIAQPLPANTNYQPPKTPLEKNLISLWENVLNIPKIGITDNFFALGGDSIVAMRLIAKAYDEYNLSLSVEDIFRFPSVAELTKIVKKIEDQPFLSTPITDNITLTPNQHWFFSQNFKQPQEWSQTCLLRVNHDLDITFLKDATHQLVSQYDIFCLHYSNESGQDWRANYKTPTDNDIIFEAHILEEKITNLHSLTTKYATRMQTRFNLQYGPMFGINVFINAEKKPWLILMVIHHLLIDKISWKILIAHFETIYKNISNETNISHPPASVSFIHLAHRLQELASQWTFSAERDYWLKPKPPFKPLPIDFNHGNNTEENRVDIQLKLNHKTTLALLESINTVYDTNLIDILLAALLKTFTEWTLHSTLHVQLEGHGRHDSITHLNSTQTVGWLTSTFPAELTAENIEPVTLLVSIHHQLKAILNRSFSYNLLRYLSPDNALRTELNNQPQPQITFNYWGQFDLHDKNNSLFSLEDIRLISGMQNHRTHLLNIECMVRHGHFIMTWTYSKNHHQQKTITRLAKNYQANLLGLIDHCLQHASSTSLVAAPLNQYSLSPLQQGLLYEYWHTPDTNRYQIVVRWVLSGNIDLNHLHAAFNELIKRHDILRTRFIWQGQDEPLQIVEKQVIIPWHSYDLRHLTPQQQKIKIKKQLLAIQRNLLDLQKAPLLNVTAILTTDYCCEVICQFHHAILDGWAFSVLLKELMVFYNAISTNAKATLPPAYPFNEYIDWLHQQDWHKTTHFWKKYLAGFTAVTYLSCIASADSHHSSGKSEVAFTQIELLVDLTRALSNFCKQHQMTTNTLFQGLWGILLHRYTQKDDIVFGVTVSGRSIKLPDMDQRVGLFAHTLPLRSRIEEHTTILSYLAESQQTLVSLIPYHHTPLSHIQSCSDLPRQTRTLFDCMLAFENYPKTIQNEQEGNISLRDLQFWDPTHYTLTLTIFPGDTITLKIGYHEQRIDADSARCLLVQMRQLLEHTLAEPTQTIRQLSLLSHAEYQQLVTNQNPSLPIASRHIPLHLIEKQAQKIPQQPAIIFADQVLTYDVLNQQADQLARELIAEGVTVETPVATCMPKSPALIVSLLAIWKAGGVYVPLDPENPPTRLNAILAMHRISVLITQKSVEPLLAQLVLDKCSVVVLPSDGVITFPPFFKGGSGGICGSSTELATPKIPPDPPLKKGGINDQLAYILHTSGTTGQPKAVAQTHQTLANLVRWQTSLFPHHSQRHIAQLAHLSFDVSLQEITYALCNGYELHMIPDAAKKSLSEFISFVTQHQINQLFLPTALLAPFCEVALLSTPDLNHLSDILVAGEALKIHPIIKEFFKQYAHIHLINEYGPTETHVATFYQLPAAVEDWPISPPIGTAIDNMQLYILDHHLQPLPPNVTGNLYIGGIQLARGYAGDPDKTKQCFIANPFDKKSGARLYNTGDKARWVNGQLIYMGRADEQLKIRGYRIEPAEIEAQLLKLPDIQQCVITATEDVHNIRQLVCYLVSSAEKKPGIDELRQILAAKLPDYMVPAHFIWLEDLPRTAIGKIDKRALPKLPEQEDIGVNSHSHTIYTQELLTLCKSAFGFMPAGIHDNLFDLGANSLSALRFMLAIEKQFNVALSVNDLLFLPTIAQLAEKIQQSQANQLLTSHQTISYQGEQFPYPIVPLQPLGQQRPLFLIHPVGGTVFWFITLARYLGKSQPVYGIQDPNAILHQATPFFDSIEQLAAFYLHCIQKVQPQGPYAIAGASFGATVTFEIAKQLLANGEQVEFVGLLDGWAFYPEELQNQQKFQAVMQEQCEALYQHFQVHQLADSDYWVNLRKKRTDMLWRYPLTRLNTQLTLFKAHDLYPELNWTQDSHNHWRGYSSKPVQVYVVPGDHETIFAEPNVQRLAQDIQQALSAARNKAMPRKVVRSKRLKQSAPFIKES